MPVTKFTRRQFIASTALTSAALMTGCLSRPQPRRVSANEKLNIGVVGAGGKGSSDTDHCASENIVALCDVDEDTLNSRRQKYPRARIYTDWRQMFDQEKSLDAVIVSTPDHMHAIVAATAMKLGKHVYCQKPLVQTVYEARLMRKLAKDYGVTTQMGNQGSAEDGLRRTVELVQAGLIGQVHQVHVWSNRPVWPQGMDRPPGSDPVPGTLHWDEWLGVAPFRPFKSKVYHPFAWRGWQDFGTGALGDMACHTANMPFRALKLGYPSEIEAETSPMNKETYPLKSKIRFLFPAREGLDPVNFWWYDGGNPKPGDPYNHDGNNKPPQELTREIEEMMGSIPGSGCLLIGEKGKIFSPDDYGARFFIQMKGEKELTEGKNHDAVKAVPQRIPRNAFEGDADKRQHLEWIAGCKGGPVPYSNFDIAAYLTEIILLGCVAMRTGRKLEWDGPGMRATNAPEAMQFVKRQYRKGWSL
ncbi:MAG TPA: Gfo/Idh/MocA family oxidoreductase [Verrucomicrobiota bacterium]|nr:Gfo/Idh/MocA family oxidoreductase [Verrucomicrobiota bacterium]HNT13228.1 Gfo/Idh/MocA family oxidoreductase [Verrucomicrobiota bacterium]